MPRYIDANKIDYRRNCSGCYSLCCDNCEDYIAEKNQIDEIPAADVQEVKHGKWISKNGLLVCSECEHPMKDTVLEPIGDGKFRSVKPYYCGKCGARMEG